jgi:alkylhydroperoxidase family enzyme
MDTKDAMESDESPQRILLLNAWQESPQFTNREKMALKWTEAVSVITENHITDELFEEVSKEYNAVELV